VVAAPIIVEGRVWGAIGTGTRCECLPADTEQRIADFTELIGTAMANAAGRAQLEESRDELRRLAEGQAPFRRVATLVPPSAHAGWWWDGVHARWNPPEGPVPRLKRPPPAGHNGS
jgi:hypothetical protein